MKQAGAVRAKFIDFPEAPLAHYLFEETRTAWFWLFLRLYIGWEWLYAGWEKVMNPAWVGPNAGSALTKFLQFALTKANGQYPDVQWWYVDFINGVALPNAYLMSHMVAFGEVFVGVALILGIFTGVAAFFGFFMSMNFLLAGTVSVNPVLIFFCALIMLAWRNAGWYGLDGYVLQYVGTPWSKGKLFK